MCRFHGHWVREYQGERHPPLASKSLWISPTVQPPVVRLQKRLHRFCQLQIALHVLGKVGGAHRRFLLIGDFPLLALRHFFVKLVQIRHNPSSYWFSTAKIHFFHLLHAFVLHLLIDFELSCAVPSTSATSPPAPTSRTCRPKRGAAM